jgi:deoxycytidine triphosphate deaminase
MIRHPTTAKSDITKPDNDQIQPNTIDLRISEIFEVDNKEVLVLGESAKQTRTLLKLTTDEAGFYHLEGGKTYQVMSSTYIKVAENEIAIVMGRSTLNRNGVFVISSIYDSGFEDYIGASLYNLTGHTKLEKNSRVAHLIV